MRRLIILLILLTLVFSLNAYAEEGAVLVPKDQLKSEQGERPEGWHLKIKPGATFTFNDSRSVAGQPDGYTLTFGLNFEMNLDYFKSPHEWRLDLSITEAISKTPAIEEFFLSADNLYIESVYLYYFYEWFGVYGRASLDVAMFPSFDLKGELTTWAITDLDGNVVRRSGKSKELTDYFSPLKLKQGLGPFFRPISSEEVNVEILIGFGFREFFLKGDLIIDDDDTTSDIELITLDNQYKIGAENLNSVWGELWDKKISYKAYLELFYPFYEDPDPNSLSGGDLLSVDLGTRWSFKLFEWMSLVYELKVVRELTIVDDWQVQNNLLLSFTYSYDKHYKL